MKKILLVQRKLQHYRKLLIKSIEEKGEYKFDVINIGEEEKHEGNVYYFPAKNLLNYKNYKLQRSEGIIRFIKQNYNEYDYIILEGATNLVNNLPIVRFLLKVQKPYIVWDAGRRNNSKMSILRKLAQGRLEYVWKNADAIIAYSSLAKKYFLSIGIPECKIFKCQNTLNVGEFDKQIKSVSPNEITEIRDKYLPGGGKMILYVGAIEPRKRIKDLIDAFEIIHKKNKKTSLVIIGGGAQLKELREYSDKIENVYLLGQIIDGVIKYFLACDIFALPSEGGLSLNQAMICGKPLVASSADGTELDLIKDGKNGYLFRETDVKEFAEKIQDIIDDSGKTNHMGSYSRNIIDNEVNEKRFYLEFKRCLDSIKSNVK